MNDALMGQLANAACGRCALRPIDVPRSANGALGRHNICYASQFGIDQVSESGFERSVTMKTAACVIVKNEERDFLEWICFHLAAGFDTILVYDNYSDDRTLEIATAAATVGDVRVLQWESTPRQIGAYNHALENNRNDFDWIAFIDSDEYMFSPTYPSIKEFLSENQDIPAFGVNWMCYGSSGGLNFSDKLIMEEFVNRADISFSANRHIKSLLQPSMATSAMTGHRFHLKDGSEYFSPDLRPITQWVKENGKAAHVRGTDTLRINHYFTRSRQHYARKLKRGDVVAGAILEDQFNHMDRNEIFDACATRYKSDVERLMAACNIAD